MARKSLFLGAVLGVAALSAGATAVSAGGTAAAATVQRTTGQADHWGAYAASKNPSQRKLSPVTVTLPGTVTQIATSNSTEYALLSDGSLYAWGWGTEGQLGDGNTVNSFSTPMKVTFPAGIKIASVPVDVMPFNTALAVDTTGHVWGWGLNHNGELCMGTTKEYDTPVELPFSSVTALAGAGAHAQYDAGGTVFACGSNRQGELGVPMATKQSTVPVQVQRLAGLASPVKVLVASFANSGALLGNGTYYDWGWDKNGQLGDGKLNQSSGKPVKVSLPAPVAQVSLGGSLWNNGQTLVMLSDGAMYAWGTDTNGQLGNDTTGVFPSPVPFSAPAGVTYSTLATNGGTSYAISATGDVYAWGDGSQGEIGNGGTSMALTPVRVDSGATQISATADDVAVNVPSAARNRTDPR